MSADRDGRGPEAEIAADMRHLLAEIGGPVSDPAVMAARSVGKSLRAVIDRLTATSAPPEVLQEVVDRLEEVQDLLRPFHKLRRYEGAAEASGMFHDRAFFDWSPQLGLANPLAPPIRVTMEDDTVVGTARFGLAYEGPPGCVHGGFIAAAFDDVLGLTQSLSGKVGMTGTLTVKYRRPTPLNLDLRFECRLDGVSGRKVMTSGRLVAGEEVTAEAVGLFVTITPEHFRGLSAQRERPE